jgi:hypothetical protein
MLSAAPELDSSIDVDWVSVAIAGDVATLC